VAVARGLSLAGPAVGVEALGVLPELRVAVGVVGRQHHRGARGHVEAAELVRRHGVAHVERRRGVEPQDLFDHLQRVGELA
jgi:hypothetical protein